MKRRDLTILVLLLLSLTFNGLESRAIDDIQHSSTITKSGTPTVLSKVEEIIIQCINVIEVVKGQLNDSFKNQIINWFKYGENEMGRYFYDSRLEQMMKPLTSIFQNNFPGTKWCGKGNVPMNDEDVIFKGTDDCCSKHDHCKSYINSGDSKYGLFNNGLFTRSNCKCDNAFYDCLRKDNSTSSILIGRTYFNYLGPECFTEEYPSICVKYEETYGYAMETIKNFLGYGDDNKTCLKYKLDTSKVKVMTWKTAKKF